MTATSGSEYAALMALQLSGSDITIPQLDQLPVLEVQNRDLHSLCPENHSYNSVLLLMTDIPMEI